jgi:hypothetical protein
LVARVVESRAALKALIPQVTDLAVECRLPALSFHVILSLKVLEGLLASLAGKALQIH